MTNSLSLASRIFVVIFTSFFYVTTTILFVPRVILAPIFSLLIDRCLYSDRAKPVPAVSENGRRTRVAVIGGGIAGCGAAWSLARSGYEVEIFERRHTLGGNAKTVDWEIPEATELSKTKSPFWTSSSLVRTGLSVLAWPRDYFRNYRLLLRELNIASTPVELPFGIGTTEGFWAHDQPDSPLALKHKDNLRRWMDMVEMVRAVSSVSHRTCTPTLYGYSILNPFNLIPLKLLAWLYGIEESFWLDIVVPVYSSSFLTAHLDPLPAVVAPIIHDIIPLTRAPRLDSWVSDSSQVFSSMTSQCTVHTDIEVLSVVLTPLSQNGVTVAYGSVASMASPKLATCAGVYKLAGELEVNNAAAHARNSSGRDPAFDEARRRTAEVNCVFSKFDRVIFACPADAAQKLMVRPTAMQQWLLGQWHWTDDDDETFLEGLIHSDAAAVIPAHMRDRALDVYSNYIEVARLEADEARIVVRESVAAAGHTLSAEAVRNHAVYKRKVVTDTAAVPALHGLTGAAFDQRVRDDYRAANKHFWPVVQALLARRWPTLMRTLWFLRNGAVPCSNTFIISSWCPQVKAFYARLGKAIGRTDLARRPMLITYNRKYGAAPIDPALVHAVGHVSNVRAHPHFTMRNLALGQLVRLIQGQRNAYFASSWCTPGTGHDLSFLSGLSVAHAIGAPYPFAAARTTDGPVPTANMKDVSTVGIDECGPVDPQGAFEDFQRMKGLLGL